MLEMWLLHGMLKSSYMDRVANDEVLKSAQTKNITYEGYHKDTVHVLWPWDETKKNQTAT